MQIFSIKDMKAEAFNRPFFSANRATAQREITVGTREDPQMRQFSSDFALYQIGTFDPATGRLTPRDPHHVVDLGELLNQAETAVTPFED